MIKYRIWDVKNKRFMDEEFLYIRPGGQIVIFVEDVGFSELENYIYYSDDDHYNFKYIIMRNTNILDINRIEIFEGDYTKNNQSHCNTVFLDYDGDWRYSCYHASSLPLRDGGHEIVGNEYETPELDL